MNVQVRDILVKTNGSIDALDRTVNAFGGAVVGNGMPSGPVVIDGACVVRCFSDVRFLKFAIANQGYGTVVREFAGLYSDET